MKKIIKRVSLIACLCTVVALMTGCGAKAPVDLGALFGPDGMTGSDWKNVVEQYANRVITVDDQTVAICQDEESVQYYVENGALTQDNVDSINNWVEVRDESGDFLGFTDFDVVEEDGVVTASTVLDFSEQDAIYTLTVTYSKFDVSVKESFEPQVPLGKTMIKAGQNTLMGIGTVFVMLIVMCLIISLFKVINNIQSSLEKKKEDSSYVEPAEDSAFVKQVSQREAIECDSNELIAVIAAAIAASTGESTDDFVVRSIKRRR